MGNVAYCMLLSLMMTNRLLRLVSRQLQMKVSMETRKSIAEKGWIHNECVIAFHKITCDDNAIMLLCAKLIVLNICTTVSSIISMALFLFRSRSALALDNLLMMVIVWLGFKFTTPWFYRLQCGCCT